MKYYIPVDGKWVTIRLEKVDSQIVYVPFGSTDTEALPDSEFTVQDMGLAEQVEQVTETSAGSTILNCSDDEGKDIGCANGTGKPHGEKNQRQVDSAIDSAIDATDAPEVQGASPLAKKPKKSLSTLFANKLLIDTSLQHNSDTCIDCNKSTWACQYNCINITTGYLLSQNGLDGYITSTEDNLCLYRVLYALLPDIIPFIDHDKVGAKKVLYDIVDQQVQVEQMLDENTQVFLETEKKRLLEDLNWKYECKGLQAGSIMQAVADHSHKSFNLYTVNLLEEKLVREQFTTLTPPDVGPSDWLHIVCVPGVGHLNGACDYDMHYIPASKFLKKLPVHDM